MDLSWAIKIDAPFVPHHNSKIDETRRVHRSARPTEVVCGDPAGGGVMGLRTTGPGWAAGLFGVRTVIVLILSQAPLLLGVSHGYGIVNTW